MAVAELDPQRSVGMRAGAHDQGIGDFRTPTLFPDFVFALEPGLHIGRGNGLWTLEREA